MTTPLVRLTPEQLVFVTERRLATLTTLREDGSPHVVPIAFTWDPELGLARMTTRRGSVKARNAARRVPGGPRAALCQVEGGRWITLEGTIEVSAEPAEIAEAMARHARRYRPVEEDPERVVLRLWADRALSSAYMAF